MMIRDRAWRRHIKEKHLVRRLRRVCQTNNWYRGFEDVNGIRHKKTSPVDYIGSKDYTWAKTLSTTHYDSRYKVKYSPNNYHDYYRDKKPKSKGQSVGLREKDKAIFLKILKENGLK